MEILNNLSPLVGCKPKELRWSPYTGYQVVKQLEIAGLLCLNVDSDSYRKNHIKYTFDNHISLLTSKIYKHVKEYSPLVLNTSYFLEAQSDGTLIPTKDLLFLLTHSKTYNDSAIFDVFEKQKDLRYCPVYPHVMLILLDAFSLRWILFEHKINGMEVHKGEVGVARLERLIENIRYVKVKLEEYDPDKTAVLCHHLANLQLNVQLILYDVKKKFIEV